MKYIIKTLFISLFASASLINYAFAQTSVDTAAVVSFLQKKYNFKGDTEILRHEGTGDETQYVFLLKEKKSKLHNYIKKQFKDSFNDKNNHFTGKNVRFNKFVIPANFLHTFVPVYRYRGKYYLYIPCDFQYAFKLTDSYLASRYMDGTYNYPILEFLKIHVNAISIYTNIEQGSYVIDVVDGGQNVYRLKRDGQFAGYFTPLSNVENFEIIAEDCYHKGAMFEANFETEKDDIPKSKTK